MLSTPNFLVTKPHFQRQKVTAVETRWSNFGSNVVSGLIQFDPVRSKDGHHIRPVNVAELPRHRHGDLGLWHLGDLGAFGGTPVRNR